jgi:hypothetical protein
MTFKVGDKVRLTGEGWDGQSFQALHSEHEIVRAERDGRAYIPSGEVVYDAADGARHSMAVDWAAELVPVVREFQVGDTVRLTGDGWSGRYGTPAAGVVHKLDEVSVVGDKTFGRFRLPGKTYGWWVHPEGARGTKDWSAELVKAVEALDSTGYPVGTPRFAKSLPTTQAIKNTYAELGETDADKAALRAELNRWYEVELAEARAEGYADGYAQGADEGHTEGYLHGLTAAAQGIVDNLLKGVPGV